MQQSFSPPLFLAFLVGSSVQFTPASAQVTPDNTTSTTVNVDGNNVEINNGDRTGDNLYHSFDQFSVPTGGEAFFNNDLDIANIFSRVTGGNISNIDGLIRSNGSANLFLLNPAGIIFGNNASLNVGGSFYGCSADSILFPDDIEFSATDTQSPPVLTINAPIGLGFRDNPGEVVNSSLVTSDTGDLIGLRVPEDETIALIGGNVLINGGFLTTNGGRIEIGSVAENSTISLTPIEEGFDVGYEEVANFQDVNFNFAAFVNNSGANPRNIEVQGRNISLIEGSQISIFGEIEGQVGDINLIASESLILDGNGLEVEIGNFPSLIESTVVGNASGEGSSINIDTPKLTVTNGAQIATSNAFGNGQSADININASQVIVEKPFIDAEGNLQVDAAIITRADLEGTGDGGDITITTETLSVKEQAQINTTTFGPGNAGNLSVDATKSVELIGANPENNEPSGLLANVENEAAATGNAGNITVNTPQLEIRVLK